MKQNMKKRKWVYGILGVIGVSAIAGGIVSSVNSALATKQNIKHKTLIANSSNFIQNSTQNTNNTFVVDNLIYQPLVNNQCELMGFAKPHTTTTLTIPNFVSNQTQSYVVSSISAGAFFGQQLTSVKFNNELTSIGNFAFANNSLTSISFPKSLKSIGDDAFIGNAFLFHTVIHLPINTHWNKQYQYCPFNCIQSYGELTQGVQFIIQGNDVYKFSADQNHWIIQSYLPNTTPNSTYQIVSGTKQYTQKADPLNPNYQQQPLKPQTSQTIATYYSANSLSDYCINFINYWGGNSGVISFNPNTMKIQVNQAATRNWLFNTNESLKFYIYSPYQNKVIFNQTINGGAFTTDNLYKMLNGVSFNYGDIIGILPMNIEGNSDVYISSNFNNNTNYDNSEQASTLLNHYIKITHSWNYRYGLMSYFTIQPNGIHTTQNLIRIKHCFLNDNNQVDIQGLTLPNKKITITYNNQAYTTTSNNQGVFSYLGMNLSKQEVINNPNISILVDNAGLLQTHITGNNPINSSLTLNFNSLKNNAAKNTSFNTNLIFDGLTNHFVAWNSEMNYPIFANEFNDYSTPNVSSTDTFTTSGTFTVTINNKPYNFAYNNGTSINDLIAFINNLPYKNNSTISFTAPSNIFSITFLHSNQTLQQYGYNKQGNNITYSFQVSTSGISNLINNNIGSKELGTNVDTTPTVFGNGFACFGADGFFEVGSNAGVGISSNWDDMSPLFYETVERLTSGYSSDLNKALSIEEWVANNMVYSGIGPDYYSYGHSVEGTFKHLQGVCGNFAMLATTMLQSAGIVSRVITGQAMSPADLTSNWWCICHDWTQAWIPSLHEWITLDPTWNWFGPSGKLNGEFDYHRSNMHVALIMWPKNTNYFSYFQGSEYQALTNIGQYFKIQEGRINALNYNKNYANALTTLFNQSVSLGNSQYLTIKTTPAFYQNNN